jgi:hypothetical protein
VVLALSFFQDQAAGLDTIFKVFTGVLLVTMPLVLLIPEAAQAAPRLRVLRPTPGSARGSVQLGGSSRGGNLSA